jgi:hypothetical protein
MVRLMMTMLMWVTVARWLYAEAELSAPFLVPVVDSVLEVVEIPTHDQWPEEPFQAALAEARTYVEDPRVAYTAVERYLEKRNYGGYGIDRF